MGIVTILINKTTLIYITYVSGALMVFLCVFFFFMLGLELNEDRIKRSSHNISERQ